MTAAAISGTFVTYKHVPTRGVVQVIVEVPVEAQEAMFAALGYPEPGKSLHVAVARLAAAVPPTGKGSHTASGNAATATIAEGHEAASGDAAAPTSPVVPEGGENRDAKMPDGSWYWETNGENFWVAEDGKWTGPHKQPGYTPDAKARDAHVTNVCDYCGETGHSAGKCPKARYAAMDDMAKARVRASLLAKDVRFHAWIGIEGPPALCVSVAANSIRRGIGVKSRREIATDYDAYLRFLALENRYRIAVGLAPEPRE